MATTARLRPDVSSDPLAEIRQRLDAIERQLARIVGLLEQRGGLSRADARLLEALASRVGCGVAFSAGELATFAAGDGELRQALTASRLTDAQAIGRRLAKIARRDARLTRCGRDQSGSVWVVLMTP